MGTRSSSSPFALSTAFKRVRGVSPQEHRARALSSAYERYEDVAEALGVPVGTVNSRLNRAMAKLRDALQTEEPHSTATARRVTR